MNEHATKVLDNYLDTENMPVPHAILIEGKWGSGKTYFLQNVYEPARKKRMKDQSLYHVSFLFVSLFGANSASDVELRIYKSACPNEAVAGSIAGTVALGIGEFFRVKEATKLTLDKVGKRAIRRLNDFVFVFDDLERVEKQAFGEVMGLINSLVAEHGRHVIIVTDEEKLQTLIDGETWKDQNEKIVGRRAKIEADLEGVIRVSINNLANGQAKTLLGQYIEKIVHIARISKVTNLRHLSWAMHNAAAFAESMIEDREIPQAHIIRTVCIVVATTLWVRSGLVEINTLKKFPRLSLAVAVRSAVGGGERTALDPQMERAKDFSDTFAELSVSSPPIDYDFIREFEDSGVLDGTAVNLWIKSTFGYGQAYVEPSWRRLWHCRERPIAETEQAIQDLRTELAERTYTECGQILHVAGLAITQMLVKDKRLTDDEDVVDFFKRYIDDIATSGRLEKRSFDRLSSRIDSYGGLGFSSRESAEFQSISEYLRLKSQEAATVELAVRAAHIITQAEEGDLEALFGLIQADDPELSQQPILTEIPVERLATLMSKDMPALSAGARLLAYRYHNVTARHPLFQEIGWARQVYSAALGKLKEWQEPYQSMALHSMNSLIRHYEQDKPSEDRIISDTEA